MQSVAFDWVLSLPGFLNWVTKTLPVSTFLPCPELHGIGHRCELLVLEIDQNFLFKTAL